MSVNHNKYIALRYFKEIMSGGNLGTLYELLAPEFVFTLPTHPEPYVGPDGFRDLVTMLHSCFPDFAIHPQTMVADGETVLARWRGGGTHLGAAIHTVAGDVPASGRYFQIDGMSWMRIKDNQIVEVIGYEDTLGMFEQLGIAPGPRTATTPAQNVALAHRYFDHLLNQGQFSILDEILADDFEFKLPTQSALVGRKALRGYVSYLRNAFADLTFAVDREVASDNQVAIRWKMSGRHVGEFNGVAPTGNQVEEYGIDLFEFWQGKIRSIDVVANQWGLSNQMTVRKANARHRSPQENNAIAVQFFDGVWNKGDFSVLDTLIAPDAIDHSTEGDVDEKEKGSASFRAIVSMFRSAMPDIALTIEDEIYAGDKVVHRWTLTGTDSGGIMGNPPTNKQLSFTGITTVRFRDGLIVERWANVDELGLLQQLGVVPMPPSAPPVNGQVERAVA